MQQVDYTHKSREELMLCKNITTNTDRIWRVWKYYICKLYWIAQTDWLYFVLKEGSTNSKSALTESNYAVGRIFCSLLRSAHKSSIQGCKQGYKQHLFPDLASYYLPDKRGTSYWTHTMQVLQKERWAGHWV